MIAILKPLGVAFAALVFMVAIFLGLYVLSLSNPCKPVALATQLEAMLNGEQVACVPKEGR